MGNIKTIYPAELKDQKILKLFQREAFLEALFQIVDKALLFEMAAPNITFRNPCLDFFIFLSSNKSSTVG